MIRGFLLLTSMALLLPLATGCVLKRAALQGPSAGSAQGGGEVSSADAQIRLADRNFVSSTLGQIYGVTPANTATLNGLVTTQIGLFGGPCDYYDGDCQMRSESQTGVIPTMNAARGALQTRACDELNSVDANVTYAVGALDLGQYSASSIPGADGLVAAYQAFHPGAVPGAQATASLQTVLTAAQANRYAPIDQWRFVLLTLCLAPDWQAP